MKIWKENIKLTKGAIKGLCEVRESTDGETERARKKGINYMPISHGFVNLFQDGKFVGVCGSNYAAKHKLTVNDTNEIKKFTKFLRLLGKRKKEIGSDSFNNAKVMDECYKEIYK